MAKKVSKAAGVELLLIVATAVVVVSAFIIVNQGQLRTRTEAQVGYNIP